MGLFDGILSLFSGIDGMVAGVIPEVVRLVLWGAIASILSMAIYFLLSSQEKIIRLKSDIAKARNDLINYEDDFKRIWHPVFRLIGLSLKQVGYSIIPTIAGALPVILLIIWVGMAFNFPPLEKNAVVEIAIHPSSASIRLENGSSKLPAADGGTLVWIGGNDPFKVIDSDDRVVAVFPLAVSSPELSKRKWWNTLFGDPNGYIPDDSPVEKIEINIPKNYYLPFGPDWMRSAEVVFILTVLVCSLSIKFIFHIQ